MNLSIRYSLWSAHDYFSCRLYSETHTSKTWDTDEGEIGHINKIKSIYSVILGLDPRIQDIKNPLDYLFIEIPSLWIFIFYQCYFPTSDIVFYSFFTLNSIFHCFMSFVVNQIFYIICISESYKRMMFMFINSFYKITCNADIYRSIFLACHNIDARLKCTNTISHKRSIYTGFSGQARE